MKKILIVEDDEPTLEMLAVIVGGAGYQVSTALNGKEALEIVKKDPPDLMLLDIMMPEIHGLIVCHNIKTHKTLNKIKVVILSSKSFSADRLQAQEAGADAYLAKPVPPKEILKTIEGLLKK